MPFIYQRTLRFQDTDAAGVVYFANVLSMCHEAYEASLTSAEVDLKQFFNNPSIAIPIIHASVDFFSPIYCGDRLLIQLVPKQIKEHKFEIRYQILSADEQLLSKATTHHTCIHPGSRDKIKISPEMLQWLQKWGEEEPTVIESFNQ
jgi:1,4-dihydroxy-2-naphthoyl-CoA hydrolase